MWISEKLGNINKYSSYVEKERDDSKNVILLYVLGRNRKPGASHGSEVYTTCSLTFLRTWPTQTAVVLPSLCNHKSVRTIY